MTARLAGRLPGWTLGALLLAIGVSDLGDMID